MARASFTTCAVMTLRLLTFIPRGAPIRRENSRSLIPLPTLRYTGRPFLFLPLETS